MTLKTKMNTEVKEKWISALRSGKYKQGIRSLRTEHGYCCLGVLCDLYSQEHNKEWRFQDVWSFYDSLCFLPPDVEQWAGLNSSNPSVKIPVDDENKYFYHEPLSDLNDSGYSFEQISNIIEQQL